MAVDTEKLKKFKNALMILGLLVFVVIYLLINSIVPKIQSISTISSEYKTQSSSLSDKERTLDNLKAAAVKVNDMNMSDVKEMYKPIEAGLDAESIVASQFNDILKLLRANSIKTKSVQYNYNPPEDLFVKGAGDKLSVCKLDMQMVATYKNFENFLKDLHKHKHFLDIAKIEILPYEKNKTILIINLQLKLYAQKI